MLAAGESCRIYSQGQHDDSGYVFDVHRGPIWTVCGGGIHVADSSGREVVATYWDDWAACSPTPQA